MEKKQKAENNKWIGKWGKDYKEGGGKTYQR